MRVAHITVSILLSVCPASANADPKKKGLFGVPIFGVEGKPAAEAEELEDSQIELAQWLTEIGFDRYNGTDFLRKLDENLAYDSIADMTDLIEDDEFDQVGMTREDAIKIQKAAEREMMLRFLKSLDQGNHEEPDFFTKQVDKLIEMGYDEPDDLVDLEFEEVRELGFSESDLKQIVAYADEYDARALLETIITTFRDQDNKLRFVDKQQIKNMIEELIDAAVDDLTDLAHLEHSDVPGIPHDDFRALQSDPRVRAHARKVEL